MRKPEIEPFIFWPGLFIISGAILSVLVKANAGSKRVSFLLDLITHNFDWLFEWTAFGSFVLLLWLASGKYGDIKFGTPEDKPDFSTFSWIAMLFCAGIGAALLYWSMAEPIYYLNGPPFGIAAGSKEAAEWAVAYGSFHWGFSAWSLYAMATLPIAYALHVKKIPALRPSAACRGLLGDWVDGPLGKLIDLTIMLGLVGGVGTTLGLNVPMIAAVVGRIFNVPDSFNLKAIILIIWTAIFGASAFLGLEKGIRRLSDLNVVLALGLVGFIFVVGPTVFILSNFTNSMGLILQNFIRMSLWTDPIAKSGFPQTWTVFYWAWWVAYAVYMGLFVARISKGRTVKEVIVAEVVLGSLGCFVFFAVIGGYSVNLEINNLVPLSQLLMEQSPGQAIVALLASLPGSALVLPYFVILSLVFQATTLDSAAYTLASITTREISGSEQPARWNRLFWALILGAVSVTLLFVGGLEIVQLSSVIVGLPVLIIMLILIGSLLKWLKEDTKHY